MKFDETDQAAVADLPGPAARATIEPPGLEIFNHHPDYHRLAAIVPNDQKDYNMLDSDAPILLREETPHAVTAVLLEPAAHARETPVPTPTAPTPLVKTPLAKTPHAVATVLLELAAHAGVPLAPTPLAQMH